MLSRKKNFLLPAVRPGITKDYLPELPTYHFLQWIVGKGSVIRTVWPAVVVHSLFATFIVILWDHLDNPPVIPDLMLTVLGVVIGFVISYRAVSGYERYWQGRTAWTQVIVTARAMSRVIWIHVPLRFTPKTEEEMREGEARRSQPEIMKTMAEKKMALDLVKAFCYALKHHMRGELGYFYEDLYDLVKPLHDHDRELDDVINPPQVVRHPHRISRNSSSPLLVSEPSGRPPSSSPSPRNKPSISVSRDISSSDTVVNHGEENSDSSNSSDSVSHSVILKHGIKKRPATSLTEPSERQPLLASPRSPNRREEGDNHLLDDAQKQLIPFSGFFSRFYHFFKRSKKGDIESNRPDLDHPAFKSSRKWVGPIHPKIGQPKGMPRTTGSGENLPVGILRCLSEWFAVLEDRGTVPGGSLGTAMGCITTFEMCLTNLECILTTPLPFVYSAHIRQTVWIYLFLLPLQLVTNFGYYTILGTAIATFIYLGFLAAGEEIEQPFGYDENDLDLDLFCQEIISDEIDNLKSTPSLNACFLPSKVGKSPTLGRSTQSLVDSSKLEFRNGDIWTSEDDMENESAVL